jgi:hypothetical protein
MSALSRALADVISRPEVRARLETVVSEQRQTELEALATANSHESMLRMQGRVSVYSDLLDILKTKKPRS